MLGCVSRAGREARNRGSSVVYMGCLEGRERAEEWKGKVGMCVWERL